MMRCEICGKRIRGNAKEVYVDGAKLEVCKRCAKHGTAVEPHEKKRSRSRSKKGKSEPKKKKSYSRKRDDRRIIPNYSEVIRNAREEMELSQKDLASKINEKESVIHRLETESMLPTIKLAKKLEKALNIKIMDKISKDVDLPKYEKGSKSLTIGDIIEIKKK